MMKNLYENSCFQTLLKPLPNNLNLIDNFENIQYQGISIQRVPINPNSSSNIEQLLYSPDNNSIQSYLNNSLKKKDICIVINNNGKENDDISIIDDKMEESSKVFIKNSSFISKNNKPNTCPNDSLIKKIDLQPPQRFISIINESNSESSNISNLNKKDNKNYNTINDLILNNLYLILSNVGINNNNNYNSFLNSIYINKMIINLNNFLSTCLNPTSITQENILRFSKYDNKKRGRLDSNRKIHLASDDDNILRKIQVHFLSFIVNYTNDVITAFIQAKKVPLFKNLDYKIKKVVNHKSVEDLKKKTIGEILQSRVSPKIKVNHENANKNTYNIILQKCPLIHNFFQKKYLTLFKEYYNSENKIFIVNGKNIQLSMKTKTFSDLVRKNYRHADRLKYVSVNYILNTYKRIKKPVFLTLVGKNKK